MPQTSASVGRRLAVLDGLRRRHRAVWRRLAISLLPEAHAVGHYTHRPRFRDWRREPEHVTYREIWDFTAVLTSNLVESAQDDPSIWVDLVVNLPALPAPDRSRVIEGLQRLTSDGHLGQEASRGVWEAVTQLIRRHRDFAHTDWAMTAEVLDRLDEVANLLGPTDPIEANKWLFDDHRPNIGTGNGSDAGARRDAVHTARIEAANRVIAANGIADIIQLADVSKLPWAVGHALAEARPGEYDNDVLSHIDGPNPKLIIFAQGFISQRAATAGWSWLTAAVESADSALAKARLLLFAENAGAGWEMAASLGAEVDDAYWSEFQPYGRGNFTLVNEAAEKLLEHGRAAAAIDLLSLYHDRPAPAVSAELVASALETFLGQQTATELSHVSSYELETLLDYLRSSDLDEDRLAVLEWRLLPALGEKGSPLLDRKLARDPAFFVEILSLCYRRSNGEVDRDVHESVAKNAWHLLHDWKMIPGSAGQGAPVDEGALFGWVEEVRRVAAEVDRAEIADVCIGHVLAHARGDEDATWPTLPVRNLIEQVGSSSLDSGFRTGTFNRRGVVGRSPDDGGNQEYELARTFEGWASMIADAWPRTAAVLRSLAQTYHADGQREDEEADRLRRGLDR